MHLVRRLTLNIPISVACEYNYDFNHFFHETANHA